jgi:hypothetical protein
MIPPASDIFCAFSASKTAISALGPWASNEQDPRVHLDCLHLSDIGYSVMLFLICSVITIATHPSFLHVYVLKFRIGMHLEGSCIIAGYNVVEIGLHILYWVSAM